MKPLMVPRGVLPPNATSVGNYSSVGFVWDFRMEEIWAAADRVRAATNIALHAMGIALTSIGWKMGSPRNRVFLDSNTMGPPKCGLFCRRSGDRESESDSLM